MVRQQAQGNPTLCLRIPQEVFELLQQRAIEEYGLPVRGSSGGPSKLARRFIYEGLGLPLPVEWGEKDPERAAKVRTRRGERRKKHD